MLNPDGVVCGNSRCSLKGYDLNRKWHRPTPENEPVIFAVKEMIKHLNDTRNLLLIVDFHGHSNIKGMSLYGCEAAGGSIGDKDNAKKSTSFPAILEKFCGGTRYTMWKVKRNRAGTARVSFWRELELANSYTLEASFCCAIKGKRLWNTNDLEEMVHLRLSRVVVHDDGESGNG